MICMGDLVTRRSYQHDILFVVIGFMEQGEIALLRGCDSRLLADAPLADLVTVSLGEQIQRQHDVLMPFQTRLAGRYFAPGGQLPWVLHLDGEGQYLDQCLRFYRSLGLQCHGERVPEEDQADAVKENLRGGRPVFLVLTGHDGLIKRHGNPDSPQNYYHSQDFARAVRAARKIEPDPKQLVIFAGACQSHYEALLEAGANFASSPDRRLVHCFDPVFVVEKVAFTPRGETITAQEIQGVTLTGRGGIGGIETHGLLA